MNIFEKLRLASGLSRSQAAGKLGITYTYLYQIENNDRGVSKKLIAQMCKIYDCKLEDIFFASTLNSSLS
jgi:DNA-binding XRE family transcriptional regulator